MLLHNAFEEQDEEGGRVADEFEDGEGKTEVEVEVQVDPSVRHLLQQSSYTGGHFSDLQEMLSKLGLGQDQGPGSVPT